MPEGKPRSRPWHYFLIVAIGLGLILIGTAFGIALQTASGYIVAAFGALMAVGGGVGFAINLRISSRKDSIEAIQAGTGNTQINQTNPQNSPTIGTIGTAYFDSNPSSRRQEQTPQSVPVPEPIPAKESEKVKFDLEELCEGQIHFEKTQVFTTRLSKGDRIYFRFTSEHPICVWIMNEEDYESFDPHDFEVSAYYKSPKSTNFAHSWPAKKREKLYVVVANETDASEWETGEAVANVTINALHKRRAQTAN